MRIFIPIIIIMYSCVPNNNTLNNNTVSEIIRLSKEISDNPNDITALLKRVAYNLEKKEFESAIYDLKECILLDSLNYDLRLKIAKTYFELSKQPDSDSEYPNLAIFHLNKSININNKGYESYALLGELSLAYSAYHKAINYFKHSISLEYNQERTHMLMGYAFRKINEHDESIKCFNRAVKINPVYKEAYIQLAYAYHVNLDTLAIYYYNSALKIDSLDQLVLYNKAIFYQSLLDWNRALDCYSDLHAIDPFHANGHYNLGFIHMELELYDIATNNFSDAIYSNSNFFEAYYSRGICFETLGNIAQAESDYKRAIEINPDYDFAIEALKELYYKNKNYNTRAN